MKLRIVTDHGFDPPLVSIETDSIPARHVAHIDAEDARRIVAAVNATAGIPTPALEAGALRELVEAARDGLEYVPHLSSPSNRYECDRSCPAHKLGAILARISPDATGEPSAAETGETRTSG